MKTAGHQQCSAQCSPKSGKGRALGVWTIARKLAFACLLLNAASQTQAQTPSNIYSYTRTSSFSYFGVSDGVKNGLLQSETIEPGNAPSCVSTSYDYTTYGNKKLSATANCAGASGNALFAARSSTSTFSAETVSITVAGVATSVSYAAGLFADTSSNALGQTEVKRYDPRFGSVISLRGPNQLTTQWTLDDFGRAIKQLRADGTSTVSYYCTLASTGLDTSANTPNCPSPVTTPFNEVPPGAVSYVHTEPHDSAGHKMGPFVRVYSDRLGRQIRSVTESFDGSKQASGRSDTLIFKDTVYSANGVQVLQSQPYFAVSGSSTAAGSNDVGASRTDYDALGRPTAVYTIDADANSASDLSSPQDFGGGTSVSYGQYGSQKIASATRLSYAGLATTTTNDKGQTRKEERNDIGEVVRVTDASGAQIAYQRDAFGNLVSTRDPLGNTVSVGYDIRGRKTQMSDPDTGSWSYAYDAVGEQVWQQSPNELAAGTQTTTAYDVLGRMISRTEPEYTSHWYYDTYADGSTCAQGIGKLCESNTTRGVDHKLYYDSYGRPQNSQTSIASGPGFATALSYDPTTGRLISQTYPSGLQVGYSYTQGLGYLEKLVLNTAATVNPLPNSQGQTAPATSYTAGTVLWQAQIVNAWARTEQQLYGNGVLATAAYEAASGRVTDLDAGLGGGTAVLAQHYTWDSLNNLTGRNDANGDWVHGAVTETFGYTDSLNRLTSYQVSGNGIPGAVRNVTLQYNALGMLLYKSDVGNYSYNAQGGAQPHALQAVTGTTSQGFIYDANGNLVSDTAGKYRSITYTSFNLPDSQSGAQGPAGSPKYTWQYDESHARLSEVRVDASGTRTTWYQNPDNAGGLGFETEVAASGTVSNRHYLNAGGQVIGVLISNGAVPSDTNGTPPVITSIALVKVEYWHKDQLGSLIATTDHTGAVTMGYAYDPFGKRRNINGSYDEAGNLVVDWNATQNAGTDRGYTGHEHLDDIGLVNMNGRIFDPTLGVFLQGDPLIQDPSNLQNYNRYGYCLSNPLTCTDPSGYSWNPLNPIRWIDPLGYRLNTAIAHNRYGYEIGSVAITIASSYCAAWAFICNGAGQAAWDGFAGASLSASIRAGVIAGVSTGANQIIGAYTTQGSAWNLADHTIWGCVEGKISGGGCGAGARGAFAGVWLGNHGWTVGTPGINIGDRILDAMIQAGIGGIGAVVGGGNFAQGARSAAYAYLFNALGHSNSDDELDPTAGKQIIPGLTGNPYVDTTLQQLDDLAISAVIENGSGSGAVYGTAVHFDFAEMVTALGRGDLWVEQSFDLSGLVDYGTAGSIRTDVILGPSATNPVAIFDLKTGGAVLTQARVDQIRAMFPGFTGPIIAIYPKLLVSPLPPGK